MELLGRGDQAVGAGRQAGLALQGGEGPRQAAAGAQAIEKGGEGVSAQAPGRADGAGGEIGRQVGVASAETMLAPGQADEGGGVVDQRRLAQGNRPSAAADRSEPEESLDARQGGGRRQAE